MARKHKILVVDDELFNLDILTDYLTDGGYDVFGAEYDEVEHRLILPENRNKFSYLSFDLKPTHIALHIRDQGNGFDWNKYMQIIPSRSADPNGRGIAMANMLSFDSMEYIGCGNEVFCTVNLPKSEDNL